MSRLPLDRTALPVASQPTLDAIQQAFGTVPAMFRAAANAPAALQSLWGSFGALGGGRLPTALTETVAVAIANRNACHYCLAAHTLFAGKAGLSEADIRSARDGEFDAVARLTRQIIDSSGRLSDAQLQAAREAGLSDAAIVEVVANVALMTLTNYLNNLAETVVDFPPVAV